MRSENEGESDEIPTGCRVTQLTDEDREWLHGEIKDASRRQVEYAARMREFGRHNEHTMRRRFGVKHP